MMDTSPQSSRNSRLWIFLPVFVLACAAGLAYDFSRPAVYVGNARLQIDPPSTPGLEDRGNTAPYLLTQAQALTATTLLEHLLERLRQGDASSVAAIPSREALATMLSATAVGGANVIELSARAYERELIPRLLDTWIDLYTQSVSASQHKTSSSAYAGAREQADALNAKVEAKRRELEQFRAKYDITTVEGQENDAMSQLRGLNTAFNDARTREMNAESRLATLKNSAAEGRARSRPADQPLIADLERQALKLREQMHDMEQNFTAQYLALEPKVKALRAELARLEKQSAEKRRASEQSFIDETEEELASAKQTALRVKQQLELRKQDALKFTSRFAEHKALADELGRLEITLSAMSRRVTLLEPLNIARGPSVQVLAKPFVSEGSASPDYLRDAAIAVAGSILLGLLCVWFAEFIRHKPRNDTALAQQPLIQIAYPSLAFNGAARAPMMSLPSTPALRIDTQPPPLRELTGPEVVALCSAATAQGRVVATALLGGISVEELTELRWEDIDFDRNSIHVPGTSVRRIDLPEALRRALDQGRRSADSSGALMTHPDGTSIGAPDIEGLIACAAHDAGLAESSCITSAVLRHTYVAYLVREGVRLGEIERQVGRLPPALFTDYSRLSPAGPRLSLEQIDPTLPAMRRLRV